MIIELFGLSKTGKTIFKSNLKKLNYRTLDPKELSNNKRVLFFLKYLFKEPRNTIKLFYKLNTNNIYKNIKVRRMRNTYLITTLAKYQYLKGKTGKIFADEMALQSIFMILQKKSDKEEINKVINLLPKSDFIFLFERSKEQRHKIYEKPHPTFSNPTMYPGGWISIDFAKKWMESMEYNYEIIKNVLNEKYKENYSEFTNIEIDLPKIYSTQ